MTRRRRRVALAIALVLTAGCTSQEASKPLTELAPTKAQVAHDAGIDFPASTRLFRLVRIAPNQIDVSFTIGASDVDRFASGSGLRLVTGKRVIMHASPLWSVDVTAPVHGAASTRNGVVRAAEVIVEREVATVRLALVTSAS